jgi:sugar O-acyltransferase (sialic acid O-acetyltransferase NeuD family)
MGRGVPSSPDDERSTRVGRFLRRTGLDALPQLVNIALGEMSFVGPRPTSRGHADAYTPRQRRRLLFRPGMTGWAQIHGFDRLEWAEGIELDLHYVTHYSWWLDCQILLRTLAVLARGEGSSADTDDEDPSSGADPGELHVSAETARLEIATEAMAPEPEPVVSDLPRGDDRPRVIVVGTGGYACVVIDAIEKQGVYAIAGVLDDAASAVGTAVLGYPVLGGREMLGRGELPLRAIVAIAMPAARGAWIAHLADKGFELPAIVHPHASVGRAVEIGWGSVVLAGAVVNSGTRIGRGVIVNSGASVDHDCVLGDLVHLAPGARLASGVRVGDRAHIGIGACVIQGVHIGVDAIVGAGTAVLDSIESGAHTAARPLQRERPALQEMPALPD